MPLNHFKCTIQWHNFSHTFVQWPLQSISTSLSQPQARSLKLSSNNSFLFPPLSLWQEPSYFLYLWFSLLCIPCIRRVTLYLYFCDWHTLLSVLKWFPSSVLFLKITVAMYHILLLCSPVYRWTCWCLYILATVNDAAINMRVEIFFWDPAFRSFGYIHRSKVTGSYINSIIFNFFEELAFQFSQKLCHFTFPSTVYKGSSFSHLCKHVLFIRGNRM